MLRAATATIYVLLNLSPFWSDEYISNILESLRHTLYSFWLNDNKPNPEAVDLFGAEGSTISLWLFKFAKNVYI